MLEPLNMFTTNMINHKCILLFMLLLLTSHGLCHAQDQKELVRPLSASSLRPTMCDVFIYGAGSTKKYSLLSTATNKYSTSKNIYGTHIDIGGTAEFYKRPLFKLGASLGYKYERFAYNKGLTYSSGFNTHWVSADLNFLLMCFSVGIRSDILMNANIKNNDNFSYIGLNKDCFNRVTCNYYVGLDFRFTDFNIALRIGGDLVPQINPNKVSYYNFTQTSVNGTFFEARISYRLFSNRKYLLSNLTF